MTLTTTRPRIATAGLWAHALLVLPSAALLSGSLGFASVANAEGFPQLERGGAHGAAQIVRLVQPKAPQGQVAAEPEGQTIQPEVNATQPAPSVQVKRQAPIFVQRGSHGGYQVLDQADVGGPVGPREFRGFPQLQRRGSHGAQQSIK